MERTHRRSARQARRRRRARTPACRHPRRDDARSDAVLPQAYCRGHRFVGVTAWRSARTERRRRRRSTSRSKRTHSVPARGREAVNRRRPRPSNPHLRRRPLRRHEEREQTAEGPRGRRRSCVTRTAASQTGGDVRGALLPVMPVCSPMFRLHNRRGAPLPGLWSGRDAAGLVGGAPAFGQATRRSDHSLIVASDDPDALAGSDGVRGRRWDRRDRALEWPARSGDGVRSVMSAGWWSSSIARACFMYSKTAGSNVGWILSTGFSR